MTRLHSDRRGKSQSVRPASRGIPSWVTYSPDEITSMVVKFGKEGLTSTEIGLRLRDEFSIPLIKPFVRKSITQVLKDNDLSLDVPEDLDRLLKRAKSLQDHLQKNRGDRKNVRSLEILEAKIHRLSKYHKREGNIPQGWKYKAAVAQLA